MFRNEADIAEAVCRHLFAEGLDGLLIADNMSDDGTRDILEELGRDFPLRVVDDTEPGYWQSAKVSYLANQAGKDGATWILPFDADEVFYAPESSVGDALRASDLDVVEVPGWDHIRQREDGDGHPFTSMVWRRQVAQRFPKVAFRWRDGCLVSQGNHSVTHPGRRGGGMLGLRHFQYRSFDQFVRKVRQGAAAYERTSLPESEGSHWREAAKLSDEQLADRWDAMLDEDGLVRDPAPLAVTVR